MKQYLLKASGVAMLALMLNSKTIAQDTPPPPPPGAAVVPDEAPAKKMKGDEEIIIRKKNDKDIKITVEVKDGKVFINGKPADEFNDDNVSIQKIITDDNDAFALISPDMNMHISPFRGGMSFNSDDNFMRKANTAFLGVTTGDADGGGAEITGITQGSGAEKAGLKKGDVITKINDIKINDQEDVTETIHKFKPEDKVTVTYKRDGKEQKVTATLGKNKTLTFSKSYNFSMPDMEKMKELSNMDRIYAPDTYSYSYRNGRQKLGIKAQDTEDGKGVKVLDVDDESPAEKAGVKEGDIITQFDGKPVNSAETLANLARENKDKYSYKLNVTRDGKSQEVEVKIPKKLKTADL
jgi:serine protease Do